MTAKLYYIHHIVTAALKVLVPVEAKEVPVKYGKRELDVDVSSQPNGKGAKQSSWR